MQINIHAGHNPDGKVACGAIGYLYESTEARNVKNKVIELLRNQGHTVFDCTVNDGVSQSDVLNKIVKNCNAHDVGLDVSIHFNSGSPDSDDRTTGSEIWQYDDRSYKSVFSENILNNLEKIGYRNRGIKYSTELYVLSHTKNPAILVECCFVDDKDDAAIYDYDKVARAIANGIDNDIDLQEEVEEVPVIKSLAFELEGENKIVDSVLVNDFNFADFREMARIFGYAVHYNEETKKIKLEKGE